MGTGVMDMLRAMERRRGRHFGDGKRYTQRYT